MISAARSTLKNFVRSFFRPHERLTPSQWVEKNIELPPGKQETKSGPVSFASQPYQRETLDDLADPTITDSVFLGPTRIGKTLLLRCAFAYSVAGDPAPTLWVDSTEDKAQDISKKEIQPMVDYNACLRERLPKNRHNRTDMRILFPGAAFTMVGGNSDAQVAGDTVKRVLGNELDKWRGATEKEASIAELVRHRTESFDDERKHLWSSTPTLEEYPTWQFFLKGDQRKWFCICPRCASAQQLVWEQVWWDPTAKQASGKWDFNRVKESARYRCINASCTASQGGNGWTNEERLAAIQHPQAHFRATAVPQPGWRSRHVNGLYGPLKSNSCGALAVDFLSARTTGFYSDRQDFWNSRMGLPWRDDVSLITVEKFAARERQYLRGEVPALHDGKPWKPDLIIISFDVQSNRLEWVCRAWDWAGNAYLVDHGEAPSWKDLEQVQDDYRHLGTSYVIGDINYEDRRAETLEQIYLRKDRGWFGAEGFEQAKELVRLEKANVYAGGKLQTAGCFITKLVISTYEFKVELEKRITGEIPNWFCYQLPLAATEQEVEEQKGYYAQILDERRVPRRNRVAGKPPFEFKSRNKNNHKADGEVYGLALFWVLQKRHTAVARKAPAARKVIEVQK